MTEDEARDWAAELVSRETLEKFDQYAELLTKWQRAINLVAPSTLDQIYTRHIADSLQILEHGFKENGNWVDIGSGAGFPGLVCAIAAQEKTANLKFTLIESDTRKSGFLREVARVSKTPITILNSRIEKTEPQNADIISARALAPLEKLCSFSDRHLKSDGICLFLKGKNHEDEQKPMDAKWRMQREIFRSKTNPDAVIYRIGELARA